MTETFEELQRHVYFPVQHVAKEFEFALRSTIAGVERAARSPTGNQLSHETHVSHGAKESLAGSQTATASSGLLPPRTLGTESASSGGLRDLRNCNGLLRQFQPPLGL